MSREAVVVSVRVDQRTEMQQRDKVRKSQGDRGWDRGFTLGPVM